MLEIGFMPAEYKYMGYQVAAWVQMSAAVKNSFFEVTFNEFLDCGFAFNFWKDATNCTEGTVTPTIYCVPEYTVSHTVSPAIHNSLLGSLAKQFFFKPEDSIPASMYALHIIYRKKLGPITPQCEDYYHFFKGGYMAGGPTSLTLIKLWEKHLKNIGSKTTSKE